MADCRWEKGFQKASTDLETELVNSRVISYLDVSCFLVGNLSSVHSNVTGKDQAPLMCLICSTCAQR